LNSSKQPDLAQAFLAYLLGPVAQKTLIATNWMYPAAPAEGGLPAEFETLIKPETSLIFSTDEVEAIRQGAIEEWQNTLSR
jgi:thiamine transport system substrate-binding protein